ncbi:MAG TPA: D-glycerate dehydrogenase [Terriglobia bacterium]|nr:D-glycerate dehydrogenase [Terriglobia bacterium]
MSKKPFIHVTRKLPDAVTKRLLASYDASLNENDQVQTPEQLLKGAEKADALLVTPTDKLTPELIEKLPANVKMIATFSVGYEHINLDAAKKRGLVVSNTPDVLTDATADIALLLMLGAARRAYEGERAVREATWKSWSTGYMLGVHMTGKRLGIFGMGRIGQAVAKRARAFDMEIHYSNRRQLPAELEQGAVFHANPDELLPHSDFLSINAPGGPETNHWLNAARIAKLPDNAIVVNTARGPLVDDTALIAALKSGKLFAAGLDVFEGEPNINPAYRELNNVFLLPHLGSATVETRNAMGFKALDNLDAFFTGKALPDRIA